MDQGINIVEAPDSGKKRIGFLCLPGLETFIKPIAAWFCDSYNIRTYYGNNINDAISIIDWADLIWLEFCNELVIELTNRVPQLKDKKVIVRLHSYEALSGYVPAVNWSVVDEILFVAEHIKKMTISQFPKLGDFVEMHVVPNGV